MTQVIDLSKLDPQPVGEAPLTTADGTRHYFIDPDSLTLRQRARFGVLHRREAELVQLEEPSEADEIEHDQVMVDLCALVLPTAPRDVLAQLKPMERSALFIAFLAEGTQQLTLIRTMEAVAEKARNPTGGSSSPSSNGSTRGP